MNEITDMVRKIKGVFEILQRDQMKEMVIFESRCCPGSVLLLKDRLDSRLLFEAILQLKDLLELKTYQFKNYITILKWCFLVERQTASQHVSMLCYGIRYSRLVLVIQLGNVFLFLIGTSSF